MTAPPVTTPPAVPDIAAQVRNEVEKLTASKNWRAQMERLVRDKVTLEIEVKRLQDTGPKVEQGGRILTKAEADVFKKFEDLKAKPEDLATMQTDFVKLKAKETERTEEEQYGDAAETYEWPNVAAVKRFLKREGLHLEFKDVRTKGEDNKTIVTRTPMVRPKNDEKADLRPLDEYVDEEFPEIIDIFKMEPKTKEGEEETTTTKRTTSTTTEGVRIPSIPGARTTSAPPSEKNAKALEKIEQEARSNAMYSL